MNTATRKAIENAINYTTSSLGANRDELQRLEEEVEYYKERIESGLKALEELREDLEASA